MPAKTKYTCELCGADLRIDDEFADLCRALTPEERNLLEQSVIDHGCLDPIIVWANHDDTILDGHNRYEICREHGVAFKTKALKFDSREAAIEWIITNQLGKRNLTDEQKEYLRGKRYNAEKKADGKRGPQKLDQNEPASTAQKLAKEFGVSPATVKRDAKFADAVDTIAANVGKEAKAEILSGKSGLSKKDVVEVAAEPVHKQAAAVAEKKEARKEVEIKTDVERLIESIEKLIERVDSMAAHRMGHNAKSKAVVATLNQAIAQTKAMGKSWRNE